MKLLLETTGPFQLAVTGYGLIRHNRPTVMPDNQMVQTRIASKKLKLLGTLTDDATTEEFDKTLKESKSQELAVASFLDRFNADKEDEPDDKEKTSSTSSTSDTESKGRGKGKASNTE